MPNAPQPSINFLMAREARRAVLLRRGPSDLFQLLLWDLETDAVTSGQWFRGKIHFERCDLSPDGQLFIYFAANYKPGNESTSWTAISRPPYFTALGLWFKGYNYNGGGLFESNKKVLINALPEHEYSDRFDAPKIAVGNFQSSARGAQVTRMLRDGWREAVDGEDRLTRSVGDMVITESFGYRRNGDALSYTATIAGVSLDVTGAKQVDIDAERSRIVYSVEGKLFAADGASIKEIADLSDHTFEPIPPPDWAKQWP